MFPGSGPPTAYSRPSMVIVGASLVFFHISCADPTGASINMAAVAQRATVFQSPDATGVFGEPNGIFDVINISKNYWATI